MSRPYWNGCGWGGSILDADFTPAGGSLLHADYHVTEKLLEAWPDAEWRVIVALCRYGGLRCPSELLALKWRHVDWERERFLVHSSKLEHCRSKGKRWVPLFPELRPYLDALYDEAPEGSQFVIAKTRDVGVNWRTQLERIIVRAGLTSWDRQFQNLRSSCETELAGAFPAARRHRLAREQHAYRCQTLLAGH